MSERYWKKAVSNRPKWLYVEDKRGMGLIRDSTYRLVHGHIIKSASKKRNWQVYGYDFSGVPIYLCTLDDMPVREVKDAARLILDMRSKDHAR
jgi:hypothetical protein